MALSSQMLSMIRNTTPEICATDEFLINLSQIESNNIDEMPEIAKQKLLEMKAINSDEKFIITGGVPVNVPGTTNYISIL